MADSDFCFHACNACGHVHMGHKENYRCAKCPCSDRWKDDES